MLYLSRLTPSRPRPSSAKPREDNEGGGRQLRDGCNNTSFKDTSAYTIFFSHMLLLLSFCFYEQRVKICWCENEILKQLDVFFVLASR